MAKIRKRVDRRLTEVERARHQTIREQVERDKAAIRARGRSAIEMHDDLRNAVAMLKAVREQQGLSLAETSRRSGIDRARLSRLENDPDVNPTLETLNRIARALGATLHLTVALPADGDA